MRMRPVAERHAAQAEAREFLNALVSDLSVPLSMNPGDPAHAARRTRTSLRRLARAARRLGRPSFSSVVIHVAERLEPNLRAGTLDAQGAALLRRLAQISHSHLEDPTNVVVAASLVEVLGSGSEPAAGRLERMHLLHGVLEEAEPSVASAQLAGTAEYAPAGDSAGALLDGVTLRERLRDMLTDTDATPRPVGVLSIGIAGCDDIVDSFGSQVGEAVLGRIGVELAHAVAPRGIAAHLGSDQFVLVLQGLTPARLTEQAARLLELIGRNRSVGDHLLCVTARIGMAVSGDQGCDAHELLANADAALHDARARKLHPIQSFAPHMRQAAIRRVSLEAQLRGAIERGSFELHYQPKVALRSGRLCGVEALVRWRRDPHGLVPPDEFIPIAEHSGLIVPLGNWVIDTVCRQMRLWQRACALVFPVAINLSAVQLCAPQTRERIAQALAHYEVPPRLLEFEITESAVVHDAATALHCLDALGQLGVRLAVDDFGTGYSNLSQLIHLPLSAIKIDKSLIAGVATHRRDAVITRAIIDIARTLGARVVAEGVETERQREVLREVGCDEYQGYLLARPMPAASLRQWVEQRGCPTPNA